MRLLMWFKNTELKYIIFGITGGFYFHNEFEPWIKRYWIYVNLLFISTALIVGIGFLTIFKNVGWHSILFIIVFEEYSIAGIVIIPLATYYFRNKLITILHLNSKEDKKKVENLECLRRLKLYIIYIMSMMYLTAIILVIGHILYGIFSEENDYLHDIRYYPIPNPWIPNIDTTLQFVSVSILYSCFAFFPAIVEFSFVINFLIISYEFYAAFCILNVHMIRLSKAAAVSFDYLNGSVVNFDSSSNINSASYRRKVEVQCGELMNKLRKVIKEYQRLRRKVKEIEQFVNFTCSVTLIFIVFGDIFLITSHYSNNVNDIETFRVIFCLIAVHIKWFCLCYSGRMFTDMQEMISTQLYDIPWYYLDPPHRKTFYIFLYLSQRSICFKGCKIYAMGLPIFFQVIKLAYTHYNFLNVMYHKRNKMSI